MQKPSQGDPINPTTPTPKPQNHDPRTSQQNQPTTPPPKQQPGKPYQHKPDHTTQPTPAETTTTTNDHSNSQPHNRTRRSLNTHHTNVKSCPQQPHQRNHQNSHQPHTHKREAKNTHYTHPHHQHKPTKQPHLHPGPTYPVVAPLETYPVAELLIDSPHDVSNKVPSNRKRDPQCGRAMRVCVMYFNNSHDAFRRAEPNCFGPVVQGHGLGIPARWHPYPRDHQ